VRRGRLSCVRLLAITLLASPLVTVAARPAAADADETVTVTWVDDACYFNRRGESVPMTVQVTNPGDAPLEDVVIGAAEPLTGVTFAALPAGTSVGAHSLRTFRVEVAIAADAPTGQRPYDLRVTAGDGRTASTPAVLYVVDRPAPPVDVVAERYDMSAIVSWTPGAPNGLPGKPAYGYEVVASPGGARAWVPGPETSVIVGGLDNGTAYTFTVRARNLAGDSAFSTPSDPVVPAGEPSRATDVAVTRDGTTATVTWSPADGNGSPVTGYVVTAAPDGDTVEVGADATSAEVTGLDPEAEYTFAVTAANDVGEGREAAPLTGPLPAAPVVTVTQQGSGETVHVAWDPVPGAVSYRVIGHPGRELFETSDETLDVGIRFGTTTTFTVSAVNDAGEGPATTATILLARPPGPADLIRATPGDGRAFVCWTLPLDYASPLTHQVVTLTGGTGEPVTVEVPPDATSAWVTGLANGTTYGVAVRGVNGVGPDLPDPFPSEEVTPSGPPLPVTTPPTVVRGEHTAVVEWTDVDAPGNDVGFYEVRTTPGGTVTTTSEPRVEIDGLDPEVDYTFEVRGVNDLGAADWSPPSDPDVPGRVPGGVAGLAATAADHGALVSWTGADGNGGDVTGWTVTTARDGVAPAVVEVAADAVGATVEGLDNGFAYTVSVRARNVFGLGPANTVEVTPAGVPFGVGGVTAEAAGADVHLTWDPTPPNGSPLTGYVVTASPGGTTYDIDPDATETVVEGLPSGTYTFTVHATNGVGAGPESLPSGEVTVDVTPPSVRVARLPYFSLGPIAVPYVAGDAVSTDARYRAARWDGIFGGYQYPAAWQDSLDPLVHEGQPGYTYCFGVRGRDAAGNVSAWTPDSCTAVPLDDRSLSAPGWTRGTSGAYYEGTYSGTRTKGATLTRTGVHARRLAVVAKTCPTCGKVAVLFDGVQVAKFDLRTETSVWQRTLKVDLGSLRAGTVTIRTLTTDAVYVDGLGVSRV
jgi:hypothetical protein